MNTTTTETLWKLSPEERAERESPEGPMPAPESPDPPDPTPVGPEPAARQPERTLIVHGRHGRLYRLQPRRSDPPDRRAAASSRGSSAAGAVRTCSIPGCDRPHTARGWCTHHYDKWRRQGDPLAERPRRVPKTCTIEGCDGKQLARGWCSRHYTAWRKHGDPLADKRPHRPETCEVEDCDRKHDSRGFCQTHYDRARKNNGDPLADVPIREAAPLAPPGMKWCGKCQTMKPLEDFNRRKEAGHQSSCRECGNKASRDWWAALSPKQKRTHRRADIARKLGLTLAEFDALGGRPCALCGAPPPSVVDHDHETDRVRGPLCHECNTGLGKLGDNAEGLRRALDYLHPDPFTAFDWEDGVYIRARTFRRPRRPTARRVRVGVLS